MLRHRAVYVFAGEAARQSGDADNPASASGQANLAKAAAMLRFMGPALVLPLSDPLMSLIDAVSLGRVRFSGLVRMIRNVI
jgi:hypothetical protein